MSNKTFVACRPGLQQQMQSAFDGLEVVVDPDMTKDYEFRQRELTMAELLEEEVEKEERQEADPKNAITFVVPLDPSGDLEDASWVTYLAVRVERGANKIDVAREIGSVPLTLHADGGVNVSATIGAVTSTLKKAGYNVLSVSEAEGLTWPQV